MHFEIARDIRNQFIWRLRADNNEIIASGESYTTKENCQHAITLLKSTTPGTRVEDQSGDSLLTALLKGGPPKR